MTKKKNSQSKGCVPTYVLGIVLGVLVVTVFVSLAYLSLQEEEIKRLERINQEKTNKPKPEFKVYTVVCENKSWDFGKKLLKREPIVCEYTQGEVYSDTGEDCIDCEKKCIQEWEFLYKCGNEVKECIEYGTDYTILNPTDKVYKKESYSSINETWEDTFVIEEICKEIETDKYFRVEIVE